MNQLLLTHHARYNTETNHLSTEGYEDATAITVQLRERGVDPQRCILMPSVVSYARETSEVVCEQLGMGDPASSPLLIASHTVRRLSLRPEPVRNVSRLLMLIADVLTPNVDTSEHDVVVIGHGNLVRAVARTVSQGPYGQVFEIPKDWENPTFNPARETEVAADIGQWAR